MLWLLALVLALLKPADLKDSKLEMRKMSVTRQIGTSIIITCNVLDQSIKHIHWYKHQEGKAPQRLLYYEFSTSKIVLEPDISSAKYHVYKESTSNFFVLRSIEESDSGVYYCAAWIFDGTFTKVFGPGTKLIVTDKILDTGLPPKPTIFLPSSEETKLHSAGTYLCLLENFFPDVIKVEWKEKGGNVILDGQQGNVMKTNDTFMKFSWLTVTGESLNREHECLVRHEHIKEEDKVIVFPSINRGFADSENSCLKEQKRILQLQFTNTSAFYTYLLLLLKSTTYLAIVIFYLFRRTAICGDGKTS